MPELPFILAVSRPRFWIYTFGPFLVGTAAGMASPAELPMLSTVLLGLYFLLPANLLIYGVNDIFDYETDKLNQKKAGYETLVADDRRWELTAWILALNIPFLVLALLFASDLLPAIEGFLFFAIFYSAPPVRAKAVPFLDSAFNVLYVFPGIVAYKLTAGTYPPAAVLAAGACWTAAMHAYSAIPDIEADRAAGLRTVATLLGPARTLVFCGLLYLAAAALSFEYLSYFSAAAGAVYVAIVLASFRAVREQAIFRIYRVFPAINAACGFCLFWAVALKKLLA